MSDSLVGLFMGGGNPEVDARRWSDGLAGWHERFAHRFARSESRESVLAEAQHASDDAVDG